MKRGGLIITAILFVSTVALAADSPWETMEWGRMNDVQKFKWAVDLYKMGRADDAGPALKRVVDANPAPRAVAEMRDALDPLVRTAMVADAKTAEPMKAWIALYEKAVESLRTDDAYVADWSAKVISTNLDVAEGAAKRLDQLQEFAAAGVCRMMSQSQNAMERASGRRMLLRLGHSATLPAIEFLQAPDDTLKLVMLDVLANLKDVRSQAAIMKLAKDPATSENVRQAANQTITALQAQPRPALPVSATVPLNYWWLADAVLHRKPFTLSEMTGDQLPVWSWDAAKKDVTYKLVPRKLYAETLAEDACFDGLAVDKADTSLRAMLIATCYSKKLQLIGEPLDEVNRQLDLAVLAGGKLALSECLGKALDSGDLGIAIQAADALGAVNAGKGFTAAEMMRATNPLLNGLAGDNRAVRFASASAVAASAPRVEGGDFDNFREVVPALSWGLMYELPARTVLIIHPDTGVVNYYKAAVRKLGHETVEATDIATATQLAQALPKPDVVLLAGQFSGEMKGLGGLLGSDRIPFVILLPEGAKDTGAKPDGVADLLAGEASDDTIKRVLAKLLAVPEKDAAATTLEGAKVALKDIVPRISQRAAEALASINPAASVLPVKSAVPALRRALASKDDAVRTPALVALGNLGAADSSLEVLAIAAGSGNAKPVRLAALEALGKILEAQKVVPPDVFAGLVPISNDADAQVSLAAARAVAVAKFDPAQFTDLMVLKRVQEIKTGKAD